MADNFFDIPGAKNFLPGIWNRKIDKAHGEAIEEDKTFEAGLRHGKGIDELISLYKKGRLEEMLDKEIPKSERESMPLVLIYIDLDNFKSINDQLGHAKGDEELIKTAEFLKKSVRKGDTVFRIGGEEFAILMPNAYLTGTTKDETTDLEKRIEKIREGLKEIAIDGEKNIGTGSFGVAFLKRKMTKEEFMWEADNLLLRAKEKGRNMVIMAKVVEPTIVELREE